MLRRLVWLRMNPSDYYHAIPLHYVPYLLQTGTLYSQRRLRDLGLPIRPRPSAEKRDRKLGVDRFVHLSLCSVTPLLADKRRRGYPHALLEFGPEVVEIPGAAFLKFNTKAWRHRDDFVPINDPAEFPAFFEQWVRGRYPSAELLIPGELQISSHCRRVIFASAAELAWVEIAIESLQLEPPPIAMLLGAFPTGREADLAEHRAYLAKCIACGQLLNPPDLPFD